MKTRNLNRELKEYAKQHNVYLYEVAKGYGYKSVTSLSNKLRNDMTDAEKTEFRNIVDALRKELDEAERTEERTEENE